MNVYDSIILGILQGFTEFLPVSSSGHLVIAQSIIPNFSQPGVLFDVVLHAGTMIAVLFYFWKKILSLSVKYLTFIIIGSIPAFVAGLLFKNSLEQMFSNLSIVGYALMATGFMNMLTDKLKPTKKLPDQKSAFWIGVTQAFAIIPGVSRSGSTIFAGTFLGIKKQQAAEFSFLLSIPAILGANVLQIVSNSFGDVSVLNYFVGFLAAFVSGFVAIKIVMKLLRDRNFKYFAYYCLAAGAYVILTS